MGDASLVAAPHRRWNPLTGEWLLVSPQRTARPWQGQVEIASVEERPAYDPTCYLCLAWSLLLSAIIHKPCP